jgi:hypothetical protein
MLFKHEQATNAIDTPADLPSGGYYHPSRLAYVLDLTKLQDMGVLDAFRRVAAAMETVLGIDVAAIRIAELRAILHANPHLAEAVLVADERCWVGLANINTKTAQ